MSGRSTPATSTSSVGGSDESSLPEAIRAQLVPASSSEPWRTHPWTFGDIARLRPEDRPASSPPPVKDGSAKGSGWEEEPPIGSSSASSSRRPVDPVWSYDAGDYPLNWLRADAVAAAMAFQTAYDSALHWGTRFKRLDLFWHREHEYNMQMYGRRPRGDIAPAEVHDALDNIFAARETPPVYTALELDGLHARLDAIWLRHSRSPSRLRVAVRDLRKRTGAFSIMESVDLVEVMSEHCLVDFRDVLICIDPRATVIYGRTRDSEGVSRRWRSLGPRGSPIRNPPPPDPEGDARSEISGSSGDDTDALPYPLSRSERAYRIYRHAGRDYERVMEETLSLQAETARLREQLVQVREETDDLRQQYFDAIIARDALKRDLKDMGELPEEYSPFSDTHGEPVF